MYIIGYLSMSFGFSLWPQISLLLLQHQLQAQMQTQHAEGHEYSALLADDEQRRKAENAAAAVAAVAATAALASRRQQWASVWGRHGAS